MIEVRHLVFEYPGLRALDDLTFTLAAGSVAALVGPNGAGKTTLMKCLCGLDRPVAGAISVAGIDVLEHPRRSHEVIGYLADFFGLYDDLTVAQCLRHAAEANGVSGDPVHAIADTAERLGLSARLDQRVGALSRGLRQRVAIGQAIIHQPRILVLDEPAAGLDPEARHALATLFKHLQAEGMTLLVSSHVLAELQAYATAMLVLNQGRLVTQQSLVDPPAAGRRLAIELLDPAPRLHDLLAAHPAVDAIESAGTRVEFRFAGDSVAQQRLLATLVGAGIPIVSLASHDRDLQQAYLASLREAPPS